MTNRTHEDRASIPGLAKAFSGDAISLLDRLRQWPVFEPGLDERAADMERWRTAVETRLGRGKPRRVLFVHGQLPGETGSGVYLQQIARESIRQGIDFHLLSAGYETLDATHIQGVPEDRIHTCLFTPEGEMPKPGRVKTPISGMSVVMPYPVLAFRDRTDDDLIDWLSVFGNRLAERVYRLQPDVIHVNHLWFLNGLSRLIAPWIPLVASAHGTAHKLIVDAPRFRDLVVPCVSSADHVCAISPESVRECVAMFQIPEERISIEGYGYEPDLFHCRSVHGTRVIKDAFGYDLGPAARLAVAVGKFADWKGFKEFAVAIGLLREQGFDMVGIIVGEGDQPSRADLEAFIADRGLAEHVRLPGKVARTVLPDIYRAADVYVLPSHAEPFGLVLMEALACGTPSVSANAGGPPHYVPKALTEKGLAVLVDPIKTTPDGEILPQDRSIYAGNIAAGIETILNQAIGGKERTLIADAMKHLRWDGLVKNLLRIYDRALDDALARGTKSTSATP
ncbi:MAG: glycosyltransferase family 4 protein [Desulfobacterales bacterium]|nr:glycosyltransferase family 4 protein [Desulfobacterales bacterium]